MPLVSQKAANGGRKTYIIAEMAWAHNGSLDTAIQILLGAKKAEADAIGVHLTSMPDYMVPHYRCLDGQTLSARQGNDEEQIYRYLRQLNLKQEDWKKFFQLAVELGIEVCAMCNDQASLSFARSQGAISLYAISAACFTERDFVLEIAREKTPLVLRIGGATLGEIEQTLNLIRQANDEEIVLLHGIQLYPTDTRLLNLSALAALKVSFQCAVGLADHIDGGLDEALFLPALAIPYGATVIEKHITLDRTLKHEDYEAALGVEEFQRFVRNIQLAELAIGKGGLVTGTPADLEYRRVSRKRTVASRSLSQGSVITRFDVVLKRSDHGLDPGQLELLIGRTLRFDVSADEGLDFSKVT
jgi:N,N'-diacetyllegionaminate synthase